MQAQGYILRTQPDEKGQKVSLKMNSTTGAFFLRSLREGRIHDLWDRIGMTASLLCGIHCLCLPWLVVVMPLVSKTFLANPTFERIFMLSSVGLASLCAFAVSRASKNYWPISLVGLGAVTLFWVYMTAPPDCCALEMDWPNAMGSALGGVCLAGSHWCGLRIKKVLKKGSTCGEQVCLVCENDPEDL